MDLLISELFFFMINLYYKANNTQHHSICLMNHIFTLDNQIVHILK